MPSWTNNAVVIVGDEPFDTEQIGIPARISGLALSSVNFNPDRTVETITGHLAEELLHIGKTPVFTIDVTGKSLLNDGPLNNVAPFTLISRADVANYTDYTRHGFPDTGSFVALNPKTTGNPAQFRELTVNLKLVTTFDAAVTQITA